MKSIKNHSGNKYIRPINSCVSDQPSTLVDVYEVILAFDITNPAIQHAIKKILCSGIRGKGNNLQDLIEAVDALYRAIEIIKRDFNEVETKL